jgi:hypothetical protein
MADSKLRCALVFRIESGGTPVLLAKYDHAGQYETHGGSDDSTLYGNRDKSYAEAVGGVIGNDPPGGLSESGTIGGFKVVQSDQHQVVYGADSDAICKFRSLYCGLVWRANYARLDKTTHPQRVSSLFSTTLNCHYYYHYQAALSLREHSTHLEWPFKC